MRTSYEHARLKLARLHIAESRSDQEVLQLATRISAQTLAVERVGVWLFSADALLLDCAVMYARTGDTYELGTTLHYAQAPEYFTAIGERRVIATADALSDAVTRELAASYLVPRSIGAMLDAPLYVDGELIGVVCHEHVGGPRAWTPREIDFAGTFADILSTLYLQRRLRRQEFEVRAAATRLLDSERLANLTRVVRALAHDVNNALTVTALHGARLAGHASPDIALAGRELGAASDFAARVLRDLQAFATRDGSEVATIDDVITRFLPVLTALVRGDHTLEVEVSDPAIVPAVPRTQLEQIVMNLCINARDSMPAGGAISLRASASADGSALVLVVRDQGTGIAPELLPRIFEPYVTTKATGSGLGLSIVRTIVDDQRGTIQVSSVLGQGTVFTVHLPLRA